MMDPYFLPFDLRDGLLCLSFLIGAGAGVVAITRRHRTAGLLALAGFLLLGIDPLVEILVFRVIMPGYTGENYAVFNWMYACSGGPAIALGVGCLIAALFNALKSGNADIENTPAEAPNP